MQAFTHAQLTHVADALGGHVVFEQALPENQVVLTGWQQVLTLEQGLVLYLSQSEDRVDARSQHVLPAGVTSALLLSGQAEVCMSGQRLAMDAAQPRQRSMLVNLRHQDAFARQWQAGRQEVKICLSLTPDWLERFAEHAPLQRFCLEHWSLQTWQPSQLLLQRAQALPHALGRECQAVQRLQGESLALDWSLEILGGLANHDQGRLSRRQAKHSVRLKEWLDSGEACALSISEMARRLGTNPVDLQKGFRQLSGMSIAAYLRQQRLQQAKQALLAQRLSVEEAAALAGYAHLSSFSAAFKRQFGVSPSQL